MLTSSAMIGENRQLVTDEPVGSREIGPVSRCKAAIGGTSSGPTTERGDGRVRASQGRRVGEGAVKVV